MNLFCASDISLDTLCTVREEDRNCVENFVFMTTKTKTGQGSERKNKIARFNSALPAIKVVFDV